ATLVITRAELASGSLRVEGTGAVPNATVTVDGGAASARADAAGAFRIQKSPFASASCVVTVSDGTSSAQATLSGCTPTAPPQPPPPSAPAPLAPANGASLAQPITISWSASTASSPIIYYNWQVATTSAFAAAVSWGVSPDTPGAPLTQ